MAGPIPVFSFVFAAYAATSGGAGSVANAGVGEPLHPRTPFRTAWQARAARGGDLFAKIAVVRSTGPHDLQLAVAASGERGEEFWVGGIVESGLGFLGEPVKTGDRPPEIATGRQVRFHMINVLDWCIGCCAGPCPHEPTHCPRWEASGVPAPLPETATT